MPMTRQHFHEELQRLEASALGGLDLVVEQLDRVMESLEHRDIELAQFVVVDDDRLDGRYLEVHQGVLSLLWSPIHAKFKFTDATIIHGDIFALAGAGRTFHESVLGLTWEAGFGLKLYFSRFLTFRLEIRDFLIPQEVLGRGRSTNNITILGGLSLWLG